jgi:hypothetical protein
MTTARLAAVPLLLVIYGGATIGCDSTGDDARTTRTSTTYNNGTDSTYKKIT